MSLMLRLSSLVAVMSLLANAEFNLESYIKNDLIKNPNVKVNKVEIIGVKDIPNHKDWKAHMFVLDLSIGKKNDQFADLVLVNEKEGLVTQSLYDLKTHKDLAKDMRPEVGAEYYQDSHLIAGKKDAKHKIVVFSDPKCPFCKRIVPKLYKTVKENPDTFALYYYHMPLTRIHPSAPTLVKAMEVLQKRGEFDKAMKVYDTKVSYSEKNEQKIIDTLNKELGVNLTKEELNKPEITEQLKKDKNMAMKVMLKGTPTIYLDGKYQKDPTSYQKLLKK